MYLSLVQKYTLDLLSKRIKNTIDELNKAVLDYNDAASKMDSIVFVLKRHYDTPGGERFNNKIANIDFLDNSLKSVVSTAKAVNYKYDNNNEIEC